MKSPKGESNDDYSQFSKTQKVKSNLGMVSNKKSSYKPLNERSGTFEEFKKLESKLESTRKES
jgi:hypothetical protein